MTVDPLSDGITFLENMSLNDPLLYKQMKPIPG